MAARRKYNWDKLFEQSQSLLESGIDYHCSQSNIMQQIRNEACKRRMSVRLSDQGNRVVVKVLGNRDEIQHTDKVTVNG